MAVKVKDIGGDIIAYLRGRIDSFEGTALEVDLRKALEKYPNANVIINMSEVEFISSSGVRVLLSTQRMLKDRSNKLVLCNLSDPVFKIISLSELTKILKIAKDENQAIEMI